jgi:murein L,D-transpeptidase YcbB/YkuD
LFLIEVESKKVRHFLPWLSVAFFLASSLLVGRPGSSTGHAGPKGLQAALAESVEAGALAPDGIGGKDSPRLSPRTLEFYRKRSFQPAWVANARHALPAAWELRKAIRASFEDGLDPAEYHLEAIDTLLPGFARRFGWGIRPPPEAAASLELLLTEAWFLLGDHLLNGRVHPISKADRWHRVEEEADLTEMLEEALEDDEALRESLRNLRPRQPEYGIMKEWLARFRAIESRGGWPEIPGGKTLAPGDSGQRVEALCRRLALEDGREAGRCGPGFDSSLAAQVARFRTRHGLSPAGSVDAATLARLNVPVGQRIDQIALNLECWRWLPRDLGERHVRVNIADFSLTAWAEGRSELSMRVVVGRKQDSTPVLSDRIVAITFNPPWNVPASIAREEILPELRKDPGYLGKEGMELLSDWSRNADSLSPDTIDWAGMEPEEFGFRIRQRHGATSALGRLKFVLTNPFNIYLHDTPAKGYFERHRRALSHGCVRVEKPVELAAWLLGSAAGRDSVEAGIGRGVTSEARLEGDGVPVHILYWTAFADTAGDLQFRRDIYGWNRRMETDLRRRTVGR